jgi:hypothetical protein
MFNINIIGKWMKEKKNRIFDVHGEPLELSGSELKKMKMSKTEANKLSLFVSESFDIPNHRILFSKKRTKVTMASYNKKMRRVIVYPGFQTVHLILHELAHYYSLDHDDVWLKSFKIFIKKWYNTWSKDFKYETR